MLLKLKATSDLQTALKLILPYMTDERERQSPGAAILPAWMNAHQDWQALTTGGDQTSEAVLKDPEGLHGALLCKRGDIVQIAIDRTISPPVYHGILGSGWGYQKPGLLSAQVGMPFCGALGFRLNCSVR